MSSIGSAHNTQTQRIAVTQDGLFEVKGKVMDMISLIYQIQGETSDFAQDRLMLTARQLWDTNQESKQLIDLLNQTRSIRPTGDADASVDAPKVKKIFDDYKTTYGSDALKDFDLYTLAKLDKPKIYDASPPKYKALKQAEVDQLIEGIKSQLSTISSKQEMLNNDTQKYTRFSDESKEAIAAIEKAVSNSYTETESKI